MNQYYYLEEEWHEKIHPKQKKWDEKKHPKKHPKFNCCNDEFWSNASLRDLAPESPILLSEEEWDERILNKYNCCNVELWSNASLRDLAPESPILLSRRRMRCDKTFQI